MNPLNQIPNTKETPKKVFEFANDANGIGNVNFSWNNDYSFLAVAGENRNVYVLDRRGKKIRETPMPNIGRIIGIDWDKDNEFLVIVQEGLSFVSIWNVFVNNNITEIEIGNPKEKVCFAKWSKTHPVLAFGTDKGTIVFYNKRNQKKIPTIGKHTRRILSGDWNKEGYLLTGAEDKLLTVSNYTSDTVIESISLKAEPRMLLWARQKTDDRDANQRTVVSVLNQKTLLMFEINSPEKQPLELVFENKYGKIVDYSLFGDGYVVVGFTEGWVAHISTHLKELREEISSDRVFQGSLDALCTNDFLFKLAVVGDFVIKFYNLSTWKEIRNERIDLPRSAGKVCKMQWVSNGQLLVVSTMGGHIFGFLTSTPNLFSTYGMITGLLTSFTEISLFDCNATSGNGIIMGSIPLEIEPGFIATGPYHIIAGINNFAWYYRWLDNGNNFIKGGAFILKRDYASTIKQVALNSSWAAVLSDGKCFLHTIEPDNMHGIDSERRFPTTENEKPIVSIGLSEKFLIMLDSIGKIRYYHIEDSALIIEYKPEATITKMWPSPNGTRLICADNAGNTFAFLAANDSIIPINGFPQRAEKVIWDTNDSNSFLSLETEQLKTFMISKYSIGGVNCSSVRELLSLEDLKKSASPFITYLDKGVKPLICANGLLFCLTGAGQIQAQHLASHSYLPLWKAKDDSKEGTFRYFLQNLALKRFSSCLKAAEILDEITIYDTLGRSCLENLEIDIAHRCFQKAQNLSMVLTIESFRHENETNILLGNVAMIFGQYDIAQEYFLKSSKPLLALDLRCDIHDWLIALNLAKTMAPQQEPFICRRLAGQMEAQGNNADALRYYEKAILKPEHEAVLDKKTIENHNMQCYAGIAKTSIKLGDVNRGYNIANELKDMQQIIEIAMVCENTKQLLEAGQLYEKAGLAEKAASIYILLKLFKQATPLISKIKSPKLLIQLAKTKEAEGAYRDAESAYEKAEDWENVIRINLTFLGDPEKAKEVLRTKCPTQTCAKMLAQYCEKKGTKPEAIEFLIMAGRKEEAFVLAQSHGEMETYAKFVKDMPQEEILRIAQFFEGKSKWGEAGKFYEKAANPTKALKLYMQAGEEYIQPCIDLVSRAKQEALTHMLLEYLMGEIDGVPKNPSYTFQMYIALGDLKKASKAALAIAGTDQEQGNYKAAHQILFETHRDLKKRNLAIPWDVYQKLLILHSYVIVKRLVKIGEHEDAARMLNRVCKNISQFPAHDVTILTSTVIEATRANLKAMAFQWACVLMNPEYRNRIGEQYKKKIEAIARKPVKEEPDERQSPCPFCKASINETQLECNRCQNNIPYCIATGKHITLNGTGFCPHCSYPANFEQFIRSLEFEKVCPMCNMEVDPSELLVISPDEVSTRIKAKMVETNDKPPEGGAPATTTTTDGKK